MIDRNELIGRVFSVLESEVASETKSGEHRSYDDLARAVADEILPIIEADATDPVELASRLEHVRTYNFCCYAPGQSTCDCKYTPNWLDMNLGGGPQVSSETTGCPELRDAIRILEVGDGTAWWKKSKAEQDRKR